jgi:mono/diheme cytochrome c family protein
MVMVKLSYLVPFVSAGLFALSFSTPYRPLQERWEAPAAADSLYNPFLIEPLTLPQAQEVYTLYCASCHGKKGEANGPDTDKLAVKMLSFQDERVRNQSPGALYWKITEGRGEMPSFKGKISEEQKWQLVEYVTDLSKPFEQQLNPFKMLN